MASPAKQSFHLFISSLLRRPVNASSSSRPLFAGAGPLWPDIDLPPKPRPFLQVLTVGLILFLACLQFLPITHFCNPYDPH